MELGWQEQRALHRNLCQNPGRFLQCPDAEALAATQPPPPVSSSLPTTRPVLPSLPSSLSFSPSPSLPHSLSLTPSLPHSFAPWLPRSLAPSLPRSLAFFPQTHSLSPPHSPLAASPPPPVVPGSYREAVHILFSAASSSTTPAFSCKTRPSYKHCPPVVCLKKKIYHHLKKPHAPPLPFCTDNLFQPRLRHGFRQRVFDQDRPPSLVHACQGHSKPSLNRRRGKASTPTTQTCRPKSFPGHCLLLLPISSSSPIQHEHLRNFRQFIRRRRRR